MVVAPMSFPKHDHAKEILKWFVEAIQQTSER